MSAAASTHTNRSSLGGRERGSKAALAKLRLFHFGVNRIDDDLALSSVPAEIFSFSLDAKTSLKLC